MTIAEAFENSASLASCEDPLLKRIESAKHIILNLLGVELLGDF